MKRFGLALILILLAGMGAAQTHEGRSFVMDDGRSDKTRSAPMVLMLHGFLGSAGQMRRHARFDRLAREWGIVAVYANGQKRRWQDGRWPQSEDAPDDVAYLVSLIERMIAEGRADPRRVYVIGHSNGGGMAMRLACEAPRQVKGIAVIATKILRGYPCPRGRPVGAIFFHGTMDRISPHAGRPPEQRGGETFSSDETARRWAQRNRCGGKTRREIDADAGDETSLIVERYTGCAAPLMRVVIRGGGHHWPGYPRDFLGPRTGEVDAGRASLRFFLGKP